MSTFTFRCPFCEREIETRTERIGEDSQCPGCGRTVAVPDVKAAEKIPAALNPDEKKCPFCANTIKRDAVFCQFCRRDLPGADSAGPNRTGASLFRYALLSFTKKYCDFRSRACRKEFWGTFLFLWLIGILLGILTGMFTAAGNALADENMGLMGMSLLLLGGCLILLTGLAVICPQACVVARRANDIGVNGAVLLAIQICIAVMNILNSMIKGVSVFTGLLNVLWLIFVLVLGCIRGQRGENRFGPDPLR